MRKLLELNSADMNMILTAIVMAIVFAISIIIVFNIHAATSADLDSLDSSLDTAMGNPAGSATPVTNSSDNLLENVNTFYTIGPIALIVVAAVGILSYVLLLRRT